MSRLSVRFYDERTGDPMYDNRARAANRALNRVCRGAFRVQTPRGRRRRKAIMRAEYPRYVALLARAAALRERASDD